MKIIRGLWPTLLLIGFIYLLSNQFGTVPAMGKLFSPFTGFWQNMLSQDKDELNITGLKDKVTVKYDDNAVPHIFAQNDDDLYTAQGYVMAKDRLWQMEFYTLVSSGRLTEVVGPVALEFDRYNRRSGMAKTAEDIVARLDEFPEIKSIMEHFAAGVNAYMATLNEKDLPVEYKILGYTPEPWSPYKSYLMLMNMRDNLNGGSDDYRLTNVARKYGLEITDDLFPYYPHIESPIIPVGTSWDFEPLALPEMPDEIMTPVKEKLNAEIPSPPSNIGSNNWAIGGTKSATGLPILSNDPHLGLTLPSIWYQMQLSSPNQNVYGSCLPGIPTVIIGFNKDIAWGVTNVGPDVMDFYKIKFKDASHEEYFFDGEWRKTTKRLETHKIKGGETLVDTIVWTHQGPVIYFDENNDHFKKQVPSGYAMRWITHDSSPDDMNCFLGLNKAKNYSDYRKALTHYVAPAQNFIFASNENDIAITPNGKFPLKWKGQGRFLLDGTRADHDWQAYIPAEQNPHVKNPPRGFVSSANQSPTDPSYPYYIDWESAPPFRGMRINYRLAHTQMATVDTLRDIQNDNYNLAAEWFLPEFLMALDSSDLADSPALSLLKKWDLRNEAHSQAASIFEEWLPTFLDMVWDDELPEGQNMLHPDEVRTFQMMQEDKSSHWFDNVQTENKKESFEDIVYQSFKKSIEKLEKEHGELSDDWDWYKVKHTKIGHLVPAFEAFSRNHIENGGGKRIVNATTGKTGPSWRMVVQLDKNWPKAYGLYPGGQSGNPASAHYDNMIDSWVKGELLPLIFLKDAQEESSSITQTLTLNP
ncbi:penicillin acylase family protein [Marinilongibacter aquaticus]|uniref:penicillin acylase family protein n=1 Tax=Marinilongibacter aquaticus TaxID=2975157 RepID=UPI0021BD8480|nr:penicillin acylase family protein [Marinilongibacter aquaticus]UBM57917.1 penicillin acylase family protein [Marinilongibacter aquaticus]